jgi:hypothetical protein
VRNGATQYFRVRHSWETKITGINGLACDLLCAIDAPKTQTYRAHWYDLSSITHGGMLVFHAKD